ncbi:MAG: NAD(P)H-dependent oxidoreductase subunit E [bacterium]
MEAKSSIVVCNIKHCLNCGNCIDACKRRHKDISRHVRESSALIGISLIPNLCRICRDPRCIEACNRNGVERDEEGHIIVTANCVGCGLCMRSCPYNAILVFSGQDTQASYKEKMLSFLGLKTTKPIEEKKEDSVDTSVVVEIVDKYKRNSSFLIGMLQDVQAQFNYLPKEALICISEITNIPLNRIYNVVTFYTAFSLVPRGRHIINVCMGTACHVRGAGKILEELERFLGISAGETTEDMKFTLETVNCLGACALGPVIVIDGEYFGKVTPDKINLILSKFE